MFDLSRLSITVENLKCFSAAGGFPRLLPVNAIIGRNNAGKSTLLDAIQHLVHPEPNSLRRNGHRGNEPKFIFAYKLDRNLIESVIPKENHDSSMGQHQGFALKHLIDGEVEWSVDANGTSVFRDFRSTNGHSLNSQLQTYFIKNPFENRVFKRLLADRDIWTEPDTSSLELKPNGGNATNLIQRFLLQEQLPSALIEDRLLGELNKILEPDISYRRIFVQRTGSGEYEIYFQDSAHGSVPISQVGSGVKTVLLVLLNILAWPHIQKRPVSDYFFGFEELENNLHPAIQRRLFGYLLSQARSGCRFFITTHSSVVIDLLARRDDTQILHVQSDTSRAVATPVLQHKDMIAILDDLDVRASDLLQSNTVIWVEGPSDRAYINRWIELHSKGTLKEHTHYAVLCYAGTLLTHYSFDSPEFEEEYIRALKVNRNAIVLMDSDRAIASGALKPRVIRVRDEVTRSNGVAWVTWGREVENYIPPAILAEATGVTGLQNCGQWSSVFEEIKQAGGSDFSNRKLTLSELICPKLTLEELSQLGDWSEKAEEICDRIRRWNGILPIVKS